MQKLGLSFIAAVMLASTAASEAVPPSSRLDNRVREVRHVDGQVYVIRTGLTRSTTIEFEQGERIVSIVAGDTVGFNFESVPGDRVFAVKPTAASVRTNVTVYTNRRSYYFDLRVGNAPFYAVRFKYPQQSTNQAARAPVREANSRSYGVSERNDITPAAIWDDGAFTYFKFARNAPIPSVFKVSNGRERSVNSQTMDGGVVRVSGTSREWAIRLGDIEVCIVEMVQ